MGRAASPRFSAGGACGSLGTLIGVLRRKRFYLQGPDGHRIYGRSVHWWSFMIRYPDSRFVRFLKVLPTVRFSLHRPPHHKAFDPPDA
jgi:hypothetical protein